MNSKAKKLISIMAMNPETRQVSWHWSADSLLWDFLPEDLVTKVEKQFPHMIIYTQREGDHFHEIHGGLVIK